MEDVKAALTGNSSTVHIWIGYFFLYTDTLNQKNATEITQMIMELLKIKVISREELLKGMMVHIANFYDALIDNPLCEKYLDDLLVMLLADKIYDSDSIGKLREHVATIKKKMEEDYKS